VRSLEIWRAEERTMKNTFPSYKLEGNKVHTGYEVYGNEKLQ
jgi:hypothetical protein